MAGNELQNAAGLDDFIHVSTASPPTPFLVLQATNDCFKSGFPMGVDKLQDMSSKMKRGSMTLFMAAPLHH